MLVNGSNSGDKTSTPTITENPARGISAGKFQLMGFGVDTTGRRLIDEIFQIAAYTPKSEFSQYIMPFADVNSLYRRKHNIRVINKGRFRMLKDMRSNQFVKTKSEFSGLTDFLMWLEEAKGEATDGVILIYHELQKVSPGMLLEALRRCNLLNQFNNIVKGFANVRNIAQAKCAKTTKSFNLQDLSKDLLNKENEDFSSATDRAKTSYQIVAHLAQGEHQDIDENQKSTGIEPDIINFVCPFVNPMSAEEEEIAKFKVLLERQNTFRPVFDDLLRASRAERQHACHLRRLLVENNIIYDKLKEVYDIGAKDGLNNFLKSKVVNAEETELSDLLEILHRFFDPEKKTAQPNPGDFQNKNIRRSSRTPRKFCKNKRTNSESTSSNASPDNSTESTKLPGPGKNESEKENENAVEVQ